MTKRRKKFSSSLYYWRSRAHFYASAYLCTAGLTNLTWFPYDVYKRGRGSYLFVNAIVTGVLVVPLLHMEAILGQFSHFGNRGVFELSPVFAGISHAMAYLGALTAATGAMSVSYAVLYLVACAQTTAPWETCSGYDKAACYVSELSGPVATLVAQQYKPRSAIQPRDVKVLKKTGKNREKNVFFSFFSKSQKWKKNLKNFQRGRSRRNRQDTALCPVGSFYFVLVFALFFAKPTTFSVQLIYTAVLLRVFMLMTLIAKTVGQASSSDVWKELFRFNVADVLDIQAWRTSAARSLYAVGCSRSFVRLASWNKFHHDYRCIAPIVAWANFLTSLCSSVMVFLLLGLLQSQEKGSSLDEFFGSKDAPFQSVMEALQLLEPRRSFTALYWGMLFLMGIWDLAILQEVVVEDLVVEFPRLRNHFAFMKLWFAILMFSCSLLLCT
ncbi:unnamed protein product, partial [Ixodes hexagonus]